MIYCDGDSEGYPRFDLPAGSLNTKELCFYPFSIYTKRLGNLVGACKGLKEFAYTASSTTRPSSHCFKVSELLTILESQRESLEIMRIYLNALFPAFGSWEDRPKFGPFVEFIPLQTFGGRARPFPDV
ncbi:uncharacterized protein BDW43DRAFT_236571 [Aspergillus alliaceus]|uniref:uncharacterized protein n=1 Tax=Petromyces alliaceus TaxID=209559 RepID=UPI0012A52CB9|nr:uncharacterized protein BDW43DRAFT_236571 [Aspergillus alliaceus]KAB8227803.1 hypothetical protein BDW43DRAFT_236571 [Aspergillus alliaceus]